MTVHYVDFAQVDTGAYDAVVVGCGFAGSVVARELAERKGSRVLVIEKRAQIGGNMYDEYDEAGILVHRFGPHIFHTNDKRAFDYVNRFTEWRDYQHEVLSNWFGTYIPVPFNKNSMEIVWGKEKAAARIQKSIDTFGDEKKVTYHRAARPGRPRAVRDRRLRVRERVPVLHPEAVGPDPR